MTDNIQKVLNPSRRLETVEYEEPKPEPKQVYFMFPKLVDQLRSLKIDYSRTMVDQSLDSFLNSVADPNSFTKSINNMARLREKDFLSDPAVTKEWLMWYEEWSGYDAQGHKLPSVTKAQGFDFQIHYSTDRNNYGQIVYKEQDRYKIYLVEWSIENFEQAIKNAPHSNIDKIGYICNELRSWGGFSYEEFKYLPFEELAERGRTGKVLQPVADSYKQKQKLKHK
jgi:hypothetical protein